MAFDTMLDPARRRNAFVVTDENKEGIDFPEPNLRPIWREGFEPDYFSLFPSRFGYGRVAFVAEGKNLAEREEPHIAQQLRRRVMLDGCSPNLYSHLKEKEERVV